MEKLKDRLIGTRVFGRFEIPQFDSYLKPFIENAKVFGDVLVVSQEAYENLESLKKYMAEREADLNLSNTVGAESPADMCNQIIKGCIDRKLNYFAIISSDLADYIPRVMPQMTDRLRQNPELTTVGVAIQGVHNLDLLERIRKQGLSQLSPDNYAQIFHNNAFAVHRLQPTFNETYVDVSERFFSRDTDQGKLGTVEIGDQQIPVGGNEEIALVLKLLKQGKPVNTMLLAGKHTIIRDPGREITSVDAKILRRPAVAKVYEERYGISKPVLAAYLQDHYRVIFE